MKRYIISIGGHFRCDYNIQCDWWKMGHITWPKKASTNSLHHWCKIWQELSNAQCKMLSLLDKYSISKLIATYLIIWPDWNRIPVYLLYFSKQYISTIPAVSVRCKGNTYCISSIQLIQTGPLVIHVQQLDTWHYVEKHEIPLNNWLC